MGRPTDYRRFGLDFTGTRPALKLGDPSLVDPRPPLPSVVRVTGAVVDASARWVHRYSVRQDVHHDVYSALRPTGGATGAPVGLIELDQTSPRYEERADG